MVKHRKMKNARATRIHRDVCPTAEGTRQQGTGFLAAVVQTPILFRLRFKLRRKWEGMGAIVANGEAGKVGQSGRRGHSGQMAPATPLPP